MAVHEQELVRILLAANLDDRKETAHPALTQPGLDRRPHRPRCSSAISASPSG